MKTGIVVILFLDLKQDKNLKLDICIVICSSNNFSTFIFYNRHNMRNDIMLIAACDGIQKFV